MSVIFMDSIHGGDSATKWDVWSPTSIQASQSPSGRTVARHTSASGGIEKNYLTPPTQPRTGFYMRLTSLDQDGVANAQLLRFIGPTGTVHVAIVVTTGGAIGGRLGGGSGTAIATSATGVVLVNTWQYWEIAVQVADSGGRLVINVDGVNVVDFTGDTRNGGSDTTVRTLRWGRPNLGQADMSDVVVSTGLTMLGPATVWLSLPNGAGNTTGLSRNTGSTNWEAVDETTPDGDTTYVFSDVEGTFDLYTLSDLPSGTWDVLAVQTTLNAKTDDGGVKFLRPVIRSGGSNATGASKVLASSYASYSEVFETNPVTTNPWTEAEVDALEVGPEVRDS